MFKTVASGATILEYEPQLFSIFVSVPSFLICETGVITILQMDFMKTECDNACKVFSILPGTLQALNKY